MSLQDRVGLAISRDALILPESRVLVAVSGGSDSVALLLLLVDLAATCGFTVVGVAHVNHGLRGAESDRDETFCRSLAAKLGLAFTARRRDVAREARTGRISMEVAARRARYECFEDMATELGADRIATGHTRDDQAETFLLRLLRGAGTTGLAGIRPRRGKVIRPLLAVGRNELQAFLAARRQKYRTDSTNRDVSIPRNWVRHRLLPMLAGHLNGDIVEVLSREALLLRDEEGLLDDLAREAGGHLVGTGPRGGLQLGAHGLAALPVALARRVVRRALHQVSPDRFHGFDDVEQVIGIARAGAKRAAADLPGVRVERNGAEVVLYKRGPRHRRAHGGFRYVLQVPGRVAIVECGCVIEAEAGGRVSPQVAAKMVLSGSRDTAVIDAAAAGSTLGVRSRGPGDRIRPFGLEGSKKLQDVLVDRKVPRGQRDAVPLVVDSADRILWIAGHVVSEDARITVSTRSVVVLKLNRNGEEGDEA